MYILHRILPSIWRRQTAPAKKIPERKHNRSVASQLQGMLEQACLSEMAPWLS